MKSTSLSMLDRARSDPASDAWQELIELYSPLLHSWMHRYTLQDSDRDDLVQEVLLAVSRELRHFEHSGRIGAFRKWLKTILVYRLQNAWRSRPRHPEVKGGSSLLDELRQLEDDNSAVSQLWNREHDRHVLSRLLLKIRPRFEERTWIAFQQVMFDGCSTSDVAAGLGVSLKAVHLAKSRVLRALRTEAAGIMTDGDSDSISQNL